MDDSKVCNALLNEKKVLERKESHLKLQVFSWRNLCGPHVRFASCVIALSLLLFISLLGTYVMWTTNILEDKINDMLILRNGSSSFEMWKTPPVHPLMKMRIFNYTNLKEFKMGLEDRLRVEEVGPYVFREVTERVDVSFGDNDTTITYREKKSYTFLPELSNGTMEDEMTVPNVLLLTAFYHTKDLGSFTKSALRIVLGSLGAQPFHQKNAREIFWGYKDRLINVLQTYVGPLRPEMKNIRVGLMETKQGVSPDLWTVYSGMGEGGLERIGQIFKFNGLETMDYYYGDDCNQIYGSDGSKFPPPLVRPDQRLMVYLRETCRRNVLVYYSSVEVMDGIPALRFVPARSQTVNESSDDCYCNEEEDECLPPTLMDASHCKGGSPIVVSSPHFCNAPRAVIKAVEGLNPVQEMHTAYLDIHQRLGVPVAGKSRFQFNVQLHGSGGFKYLERMNGKVIPIVWLERDIADFPPDLRKLLYFTGVTLDYLKDGLRYGLPAVGLASLLALLGLLLWRRHRLTCRRLPDHRPLPQVPSQITRL